jgi:hypothetical protein
MTDDCSVPPSETPESETPNISPPEDATPRASKAESNRENAKRSTGPKTERGKAYSRLNALKHGILAAQTVNATIEGSDERKMFDETVEGLEADYHPVGTLEQLLVQQVASCFWRYRRLLQFENRAAFSARDRRAHTVMNPSFAGAIKFQPLYTIDGKLTEADEVFREAGMDRIDLPDEYDTNRITRYEATIVRTMHRAMAKLEALRKARKAAEKETGIADPPQQPPEVVVDVAAQERDQKPAANMLPPFAALRIASSMREMSIKERAKKAAKKAAKEAAQQAEKPADAAAPENIKTDQTKPNSPAYPHTERDRGVLLKAIDDLAKIGNPSGSKRPPSN